MNIDYIIIDGGSDDGTLDLLAKYESKQSKIISERDNGIYDSMNKGISLATGDIIGILNSDDCYSDIDIINIIVDKFKHNNDKDMLFADLMFVNKDNRILRYYSAKRFSPNKLKFGIMPATSNTFCQKKISMISMVYTDWILRLLQTMKYL